MNVIESVSAQQLSRYIGTAGWSIPAAVRHEFGEAGTALQRYATRFDAVEINSSFYRPHQAGTYARWAESVPSHFRFSVKIPKTITHECRLIGAQALLTSFLSDVTQLGHKLGCLLVQLPPSLAYDAAIAYDFFEMMREQYSGPVALEPRHASWFEAEVMLVLLEHRVARVGADPALHMCADIPDGDAEVIYLRLHGSPRVYYSSYEPARLDRIAQPIRDMSSNLRAAKPASDLALGPTHTAWCIFDNTASGAAAANALTMTQMLGDKRRPAHAIGATGDVGTMERAV